MQRWRGGRREGARKGVLLAGAVALGLVHGAARADELLVVESTSPAHAAGDLAPTGTEIDVPANTEVTLVAPSGGILKIEGPWQGRIEGPQSGDPGLIQRLYALFQMPARRSEFGATRSTARCLSVNLELDKDICVHEPACVAFQATIEPQEPLVLTGPDGDQVQFSRGSGFGSWRWPGDFIQTSGTYTVTTGDGQASKLQIHLQPEVPGEAHAIAWMSEQGCLRQAQEALAELSDGAD